MDLLIVEDNAGFRPEVTVGCRVFTTLSFRTREYALLAGKRIVKSVTEECAMQIDNIPTPSDSLALRIEVENV